MQRKDYATAILLNLFFPGVGYIYAGRKVLGIIVLLLFVGASFAVLNGSKTLTAFIGLLSVIGAIDGYLTVKKNNDQLETACLHCAEKIQRSAKICKHCQKAIAI